MLLSRKIVTTIASRKIVTTIAREFGAAKHGSQTIGQAIDEMLAIAASNGEEVAEIRLDIEPAEWAELASGAALIEPVEARAVPRNR